MNFINKFMGLTFLSFGIIGMTAEAIAEKFANAGSPFEAAFFSMLLTIGIILLSWEK